MRTHHKLILIFLVGLAGAAVAALIWTGRSSTIPGGGRGPNAWRRLVDQTRLENAEKLASLAATRREQRMARDAERLADHEVDVAFSSAMRTATKQSNNPSPEIRAIQERVHEAQAEIKQDQDKLQQLNAQTANVKGDKADDLQDQIQLTEAELALDQDALGDAKEDLIRAGGDARSWLQRLWDEHQSKQHPNGSGNGNGPVGTPAPALNTPAGETVYTSNSLLARVRTWQELRAARMQLTQAQQDALTAAAALSVDHNALEKKVQDEQSQRQALSQEAANLLTTGKPGSREESKKAAAAALATLHRLSDDEKDLADLDKRVQDLHDLGGVYGQWMDQFRIRQFAALHDMFRSALWIALALLFAFLVDRLIDKAFARVSLERKQLATLRGVLRFSAQALAVLVILLVIFGSPNQMSTVLGLAGAGLTVALKDFVVSFCGWFVLMGRNGIRVGDWVEINGVRGEVLEIGLLRTILLETGNWTDPTQPTGRQVALLNSFAVEGHYFNFTTSGQWLWDELKALIPWGVDPYPIIERVQSAVEKETERGAKAAEQEWQHVARRYGVQPFSAAPAVSVRVTDPGVEITVRYITRSNERYEVRSRLNHAALKLIRQAKTGSLPPLEPVPAASGADRR